MAKEVNVNLATDGISFKDVEDYVKKNNNDINIVPTLVAGDSFNVLSVQDDVKTSAYITAVDDEEAYIQDGDYTASGAYGGIELSNRKIEVKELHIKESYKKNQLLPKVTQLLLKKGSDTSDFPTVIQNLIEMLKKQSLNRKNEQSIWLADEAYVLPYPGATDPAEIKANKSVMHLTYFDGLVKLAKESANTQKSGVAPSTWTAANALANAKRLAAKYDELVPELINEEKFIFLQPLEMQAFVEALGTTYIATQSFKDDYGRIDKIRLPFGNFFVKQTIGLQGSNEKIVSRPKNLVIGTDLVGEENKFEFRKLENRSFELFGIYKLGAQIYKESETLIEKA